MGKYVKLIPLLAFVIMFIVNYLLNIYVINHTRPIFGAFAGGFFAAIAFILPTIQLINYLEYKEKMKKL